MSFPQIVTRVTNGAQLVAVVRECLPGYAVVGNEDGGCQILHQACDSLLCVEWPGFPPLAEAAAVAAGHADVCDMSPKPPRTGPAWATVGERYTCTRPHGCGYSWIRTYTGWHGPTFPDGDTSCARDLTHEELKDGWSDCWRRIKMDNKPAEASQ